MHVVLIHICRQTFMHINKINKSFKKEKLRWSPTRVWERGKDRGLKGFAGSQTVPDSVRDPVLWEHGGEG